MEKNYSGNFGFIREIDMLGESDMYDTENEQLGVCGFIDDDFEVERLEKLEEKKWDY